MWQTSGVATATLYRPRKIEMPKQLEMNYTCDTCQTTAKVKLDTESHAVEIEPCVCVLLDQATGSSDQIANARWYPQADN
jgi:hypothetical protein